MSAISPVFTYFRSIGVEGKEHDQWVTESLKLVPKPTLVQRLVGCCGGLRRTTSITQVKVSLDEIIKEAVEDPQERAEALFVQGVLENIECRRDPHLVNLGRLNALLNTAIDAPLAKKAVTKQYFTTGAIVERSESARHLKAAGCGVAQKGFGLDVLALIFRNLCLKDHCSAAATCDSWYRAAARPDAFDIRSLTPEEKFYLSSLLEPTIQGVRENRRLQAASKTRTLSDTFICRTSFGSSENTFQYQPAADDPVIIKDTTYFTIVDLNVRIAHAFRSEYELLYVKDLNKIFVVDKDHFSTYGLYEIDLDTGSSTRLTSQMLVVSTFHMAYHNNKIWIVTGLGSLSVYDRATSTFTQHNWPLNPSSGLGRNHFTDLRHLYTSPGAVATFEAQDLENPTQPPHVIPGSEKCLALVANTPNALYVSKGDKKTVVALDVETGRELKTFTHPYLTWLWQSPAVQVNNGLLYVSVSMSTTHVYDILTGKHIRKISFGWTGNNAHMQIFANKIVYRVGNEVRMKSLAGY